MSKETGAHESNTNSRSPFLDRPPIETARALTLLAEGKADLVGRMPYSSNATFLVDVHHDGLHAQAIYKPEAGERPLWDFPDGLYQREVAAFEIDDVLGWGLVPPTIVRDDMVHGVGSVQLFMPNDHEEHYFSLHEADDTYDDSFRRICVLDLVINNTDRKSGHCLLGTDGRIWAIDHGVALHHEFKLRTVIWDFAGDWIDDEVCDDLWRFLAEDLPGPLSELLSPLERDAMRTRARAVATARRFPEDDTGGRRWPWPLI
ncbi:MAG: SCO1664 family protein [Actinobacteria bacterium]|jgi:uncharacterized repeat protein (TIGR03843 family)|nr:SCO1664 family protein [Actinomycetota bacterium]